MCLPVKPYRVEREWEHAGLRCAVVQVAEGLHRCGYVRVPPQHPCHGKPNDEVKVEVHGGLTFAQIEPCRHQDGTGWWFGFDCAHICDAQFDPDFRPRKNSELARLRKLMAKGSLPGAHYWTQEEVEQETERLAEQLGRKDGEC